MTTFLFLPNTCGDNTNKGAEGFFVFNGLVVALATG
jgi:hypothetical protein